MLCEKCGNNTGVSDSRAREVFDSGGNEVSMRIRRRACKKCTHRFTTVEVSTSGLYAALLNSKISLGDLRLDAPIGEKAYHLAIRGERSWGHIGNRLSCSADRVKAMAEAYAYTHNLTVPSIGWVVEAEEAPGEEENND